LEPSTADTPIVILAAFKDKDLKKDTKTTPTTNYHHPDTEFHSDDIYSDNNESTENEKYLKISALGSQGICPQGKSSRKGWSNEQKLQLNRFHDYFIAGHAYFGISIYNSNHHQHHKYHASLLGCKSLFNFKFIEEGCIEDLLLFLFNDNGNRYHIIIISLSLSLSSFRVFPMFLVVRL
jgi:hypothetical protein